MTRANRHLPYTCKTLCIILLAGLLTGQLTSHSQTLPNRRYTTADGLNADRITCAVQDQKGFMWLGTYYGISRYDGYRFTTIPLPAIQQNKYVAALTAAHGKVYAGFWFNGGLMEYSQGRVKAYTLPGVDTGVQNNVTALCPHNENGILVAGGHNSVYHFVNGQFRRVLSLDVAFTNTNATSLAMDKHGNVWAGTDKGILVSTPTKTHLLMPGRSIQYIRQTENGTIVVSTNGTDCRMVKFTNTADSFHQQIIWRSSEINPIVQNSFHHNNFWVTDTAGRFLHLTSKGEPSDFSTEGISKGDIHFLYADRENNLWIATHTGLVKMSNLPALSYAFAEKAYGTGDITGNDSLLWVTNSEYLYTIKNGKMTKAPEFRDKNNMLRIGRLLQQKDHLWISLENAGLLRVQLNKDKLISKKYFGTFNNETIKTHSLKEDSEGHIWVGGRNGIFLFKDGKPKAHLLPTLPDGQPLFIVSLAVDARNKIIWLGDNEHGVHQVRYRLVGDSIAYAVTRRIYKAEGLQDGHIRSMYLDSRGMLWCGTRFGGIYRIQELPGQLEVKNLTAKAQLACARVTDIREEGNDAIWLATCSGIYRYHRSTDQWQSFTAASGLMDSEIFTNHISPTSKRCWAVSTSGVTSLKYDENVAMQAPPVNITAITVLGKTDTSALFNNYAHSYSSDESSIGFRFAGATFTDEKRIWYKYILEGHDRTWSDATQTNSVNYVSLPPGDYVFKVLASASNNRWSETPATFAFTIVRPFYKSPLFFALLAVAAFAGFYFFRMYQLQHRLKLERVRSRISADLHDDIGSTLSSISIISENVLQEKDPAASKEMIREISDNALQLMDKMDDIIWCVNPQNDSFQHLMLRIRKFASSVFEAKGLEYDIEVDPFIGDSTLPMDHRQHLYLILKEAINNLVKYSEATYARITIELEEDRLDINVTDNGKGFDVSAAQHGNGLRNMQRRAALMKASLQVKSSAEGTCIHLRTKIK